MEKIKNYAYYPGLDLLKFVMAILIVAIHTKLFIESQTGYRIMCTIDGFAVPTFFVVSSFILFSKVRDASENERQDIFRASLKRLIIFYIVWYVLMLPMTYYTFFRIANWKEILYAAVFNSTFSGYWFIKSLIINTLILYLCRTRKNIWLCLSCSLPIYLFFSYNLVFHWIQLPFSAYPCFFFNTAYFAIGALLATNEPELLARKRDPLYQWLLVLFVTILAWNTALNPLCKLIMPILLVSLGIFVKTESKLYRTLRTMSILLFVMQFMLIWLYNDILCGRMIKDECINSFLSYSVVKFVIILIIEFFFSLLIIYGEKRYSLFKYLH